MKIKVCGMREPANVREVARIHPDYMGFIFHRPSPRHIGDMPKSVLKLLPTDIKPVLVTVDMPEQDLVVLAMRFGFKALQLHGNESPEECQRLRRRYFVIKAIPITDESSFEKIKEYEGKVDLLLLDTASPFGGGSGKKFDWGLLDKVEISTDFLLSGGIGPEDAEAIAAISHPHIIGIDINSRFELAPALKSLALLSPIFKLRNP